MSRATLCPPAPRARTPTPAAPAPRRTGLAAPAARPSPTPLPGWWRWCALAVVLVGPFLGVVDFFIVNVSVPAIRRSLGASFSEVELVITGYGLAYAVCLITGGRLGDLFGRKRMFLVGLVAFTLSSALCGWAPDAGALVGWRVVQGATAAVMFPQALAFIQVQFRLPAERRIAFAAYGATLGFGSIVGQIMGGLLLSWNLFGWDWRPVFLVNLPVGLATVAAAAWVLPADAAGDVSRAPGQEEGAAGPVPARAGRRWWRALDLGGTALVSTGLFLLAFPLVEGHEAGWPAWIWCALAASLPVLVWFYRYEQGVVRRGGTPLVHPALLGNGGFVSGLVITLVYFAGHTSMLLALTLYLQGCLQLGPLPAALTLVPFSFGFLVGSSLTGRVVARLAERTLSLGTGLVALALLALIGLAAATPAGTAATGSAFVPFVTRLHPGALMTAVLFLYGIGRGFVTAPLFQAVLRRVRPEDAGAASGVLSAVQQIANSVGVTMIGVVLFGVLTARATPANYAHAFVLSCWANLAMLGIAGLLLGRLGPGRPAAGVAGGASAAAHPVVAEG